MYCHRSKHIFKVLETLESYPLCYNRFPFYLPVTEVIIYRFSLLTKYCVRKSNVNSRIAFLNIYYFLLSISFCINCESFVVELTLDGWFQQIFLSVLSSICKAFLLSCSFRIFRLWRYVTSGFLWVSFFSFLKLKCSLKNHVNISNTNRISDNILYFEAINMAIAAKSKTVSIFILYISIKIS